MKRYIDCDYIIYEYTQDFIEKHNPKFKYNIHYGLNDYTTTCSHGLWRDGSFGNALLALKCRKSTDALHVIMDNVEILTITRDTPESEYIKGVA